MDFWINMSEGRGVCLSEELDFNEDSNNNHGSSKNKVMVNVESYPLVSNSQALEGLDFIDNMGFSDEIRRPYSISSDEIVADFRNVSTSFGEDNKVVGVRDSSVVREDSKNRDSSLVDLKLGWLADVGECSKDSVYEVSNSESSTGKRARSTSLCMQSPRCIVLGCNKDLSSYKGYYKRHKVCDEHTRTARVIVHGIEQRFCQQCSRFHQLNEFDEGKRSCRRRLAAHNKRRRKPRLASDPGSGIIEFSSSRAFSERLPGDDPSRYEELQWVEHVKVEDSIKNSDILLHKSVGETKKNFPTSVDGSFVGTATPTAAILNSSNVQQVSRALSLLSAESRNMPGQMLESALTTQLFNKNGHAGTSVAHRINNSAGIFKDVGQSGPHAPGMCMEADDVESTRIMHSDNDNDNAVDLHLPGVGTSSKSNTSNATLGRGIILDLLELSSHLQRVEQQRHSTESEAV